MTKGLITLAGWDPSAGAGALLDLRVFERLGRSGFAVLTAVTAQTAAAVDRVFPVPARAVTAQFDKLAEAVEPGGVKVGMLATAANVGAAGRILGRLAGRPRVLDPVLRASSGAPLLEKKAWPRLLDVLAGKVDLITPNLDETAVLAGRPVRDVPGMKAAAAKIHDRSGAAVLVKGGHLEGRVVDVLFDGQAYAEFPHPRSPRSVHGTGCFLSAAILVYLAEGRPLKEACGLGVFRVGQAIRAAAPAGGDRWVFDFSRERGRVPLPPRG